MRKKTKGSCRCCCCVSTKRIFMRESKTLLVVGKHAKERKSASEGCSTGDSPRAAQTLLKQRKQNVLYGQETTTGSHNISISVVSIGTRILEYGLVQLAQPNKVAFTQQLNTLITLPIQIVHRVLTSEPLVGTVRRRASFLEKSD